MRKNKIKRIFLNKTTLFICSFLGMLALNIVLDKNFSFKGIGPLSWEEILSPPYIVIVIIGSLGFAAWMTWVAFDEWGNV